MQSRRSESSNFLSGVSLRSDFRSSRLNAGRSPLRVSCTGGLKAKGKRHLARDITVKRIMGQGSFGQVFEGTISTIAGDERVVLKRTKPQIPGAQEMSQMEHVLNVYASKVCRSSVADFMGYCGVSPEEATGNLTPGTWLVWRFQGEKTLATYMRRRDTLQALAEDLDIPETEVPRTVLKQILLNLKGLHSAGLVHRDVKPSNLVFSEEEKQFKFIDLGACADLRLGTNYVPEESILDAVYCPPEQYVLPTDAPQLSTNAFSMVISPMLWTKHKPDRFDVYSAGLIFFQLAVPTMCPDRAIKAFRSSFERHNYDLDSWRNGSALLPRHTEILDANDGLGWDLLKQMLRPRRVEQNNDGTVNFVDSDEGVLRISVEAALAHSFFKVEEQSGQKPLLNLWRKYSRKLFDLEGRILNQVVETEQQTTTVKKLQSQVERGEATEQELKTEEKKLTALETSLQAMQKEFVSLSKKALKRFGTKQEATEDSPSSGVLQSVEEAAEKKEGEERGESKSLFGWLRGWGSRKGGDGDGMSPVAIPGRPENLVYMGLKFTGLAARVAGDLAKSVKKDAEKLMAEMEEENNQRRRQEVSDRRFLEMLKSSNVTTAMEYADIEGQFKGNEAFTAVQPGRRELLFAAYMCAMKERQRSLAENSEENLRSLFVKHAVSPTSTWQQVAAKLAKNEIFLAVDDASTRRRIFDEVVEAEKDRIEAKQALRRAESNFRCLLREADPPITRSSSWPHVKRQLFVDDRYQELPEPRRVELFKEYRQIVEEIEIEEEESGRLKELEKLKAKAASDTAAAEARLAQLMSQRQNLKDEYQKMQGNLERMEETLNKQKERNAEKEQAVQHEEDGSIVYHFDQSIPESE